MTRLPLIIALFVLCAAGPAMAVKRSGNDILVDCTNLIKTELIETVSQDKVLGMGYCIGLIDGFVTFNYVYESLLRPGGEESDLVQICLPDRISTRQMAKVIVKFLEDNPSRLPESGQALAAQALVTEYPCKADTLQ